MVKRRETKTVDVGGIKIGSGYPVAIQSMTNTDTQDVPGTVEQINRLERAGCEIVRVAVKDSSSAKAIASIKQEITIPLVADIHFDHKLALEAAMAGSDKIRINPGNIRNKDDIAEVISVCGEKGIPIRVGVNSGSIPEDAYDGKDQSSVMVNYLLKYMEPFRQAGFEDVVISIKSSDIPSTVEAYRKMAAECDYPFHIGATASGLPEDAAVRSSIAIGALLLEGIGDTVRVSLTGDPEEEIIVAKRILAGAGSRKFGHEIISCPTCGRCQVDLISLVKELESSLKRTTGHGPRTTDKPLIIAVMGCEVNGPGEARIADMGVAFGKGKGAIFVKGKIVKTVDVKDAVKELVELIEERQ